MTAQKEKAKAPAQPAAAADAPPSSSRRRDDHLRSTLD